MNKKNIFLWTLYDFANSIISIVFLLYFSQWLVVDKGVSDFWYNALFAISSIMLIFTTPILGSIADKNGKQQRYLNWISILTMFAFVGLSLITLFLSDQVFLAALVFLIASYLYQFSFVFYNALLPYIAPREKWGRVSGLGQVGNWLGQIFGLLITLPFASGAVYLIGTAGRAQVFLPATILFFVLALPMLLFFKLPGGGDDNVKINLKEEYLNYWSQFKELVKIPNLGLFLLSFFFFNDAILTAASNFPIYLQKVFAVEDKLKSFLMLAILATSAIGAYAAGILAGRIGLKKTLKLVLGSWLIIFPALGLASNFKVFVIFTVLMGLTYGATWTVTRAAMTVLCPKEKLNFGFSFYTLAGRFSTLVGPLTWGLMLLILKNFGLIRYKIAIASMTIFVVVGVFILRKVEIQEAPI